MPIDFVSQDRYETTNESYIFTVKNPLIKFPVIFPIKREKQVIALYQSTKSPCLGSTIH